MQRNDTTVDAEAWGSISNPIKLNTVSPTTRHRYDVSLEFEAVLLRRLVARWAPSVVTRFGIIPRVQQRLHFKQKNPLIPKQFDMYLTTDSVYLSNF